MYIVFSIHSERRHFSAACPGESSQPISEIVTLLSDTHILMIDNSSKSVKLFNLQVRLSDTITLKIQSKFISMNKAAVFLKYLKIAVCEDLAVDYFMI